MVSPFPKTKYNFRVPLQHVLVNSTSSTFGPIAQYIHCHTVFVVVIIDIDTLSSLGETREGYSIHP